MSVRIAKYRRAEMVRRIEVLREAYNSPTGCPWAGETRAKDRTFDAFIIPLQLASLPRGLRLWNGVTKTLMEKYPDCAEIIKYEMPENDRIEFRIGNEVEGRYLVVAQAKGYYRFAAYKDGTVPPDYPGYQELLSYIRLAARCVEESIERATVIITVLETASTYRQITALFPHMIHLLPKEGQEDINTAKRRSRRPADLEYIRSEHIEAAEVWLATALLAEARGNWVPHHVQIRTLVAPAKVEPVVEKSTGSSAPAEPGSVEALLGGLD